MCHTFHDHLRQQEGNHQSRVKCDRVSSLMYIKYFAPAGAFNNISVQITFFLPNS